MSSSVEPVRELTIAEAAVAFGTGRRFIRTKLYAGEFRHASKDAQGFWRIPESDLLAAGLHVAEVAPTVPAEPGPPISAPVTATETDELGLLRLEVLDLRHRLERAEAVLEAERKLSEERARALDNERATVDALYRQMGVARPTPAQPDAPRPDWKASMRAARERDLQLRAAREREARQRAARSEAAAPAPAPDRTASVEVGARALDRAVTTDTVGTSSLAPDPERRHRWRRR